MQPRAQTSEGGGRRGGVCGRGDDSSWAPTSRLAESDSQPPKPKLTPNMHVCTHTHAVDPGRCAWQGAPTCRVRVGLAAPHLRRDVVRRADLRWGARHRGLCALLPAPTARAFCPNRRPHTTTSSPPHPPAPPSADTRLSGTHPTTCAPPRLSPTPTKVTLAHQRARKHAVQQRGDAEVCQLDAAPLGHQQVLGLQVSAQERGRVAEAGRWGWRKVHQAAL